jgi:lipase chaperone LimK
MGKSCHLYYVQDEVGHVVRTANNKQEKQFLVENLREDHFSNRWENNTKLDLSIHR